MKEIIFGMILLSTATSLFAAKFDCRVPWKEGSSELTKSAKGISERTIVDERSIATLRIREKDALSAAMKVVRLCLRSNSTISDLGENGVNRGGEAISRIQFEYDPRETWGIYFYKGCDLDYSKSGIELLNEVNCWPKSKAK